VILDAVLLFVFAARLTNHGLRFLSKLAAVVVAGLLVLYGATIPNVLTAKAAFILFALAGLGLAVWFWAMTPDERRVMAGIRGKPPIS
jgi:hypothetical protein